MTKEQIKALLVSDNRAVEKGIVTLFNRQTEDEKCDGNTRHTNGRGFNYKDAPYGSYMAKWVLSGKRLTGKHLAAARRMCVFYSKQLVEVSEERLSASTISYTDDCDTLDGALDPFYWAIQDEAQVG